MPFGPQPCSSSPSSVRLGSADSVVLPVPERPKNSAAVAVGADVGRAVHRHDVLGRQIEVERGEHRLLHLAGVGRAADQHDLTGEIDRHHGVGALAAAVTLGVGAERRQVDDGEFGHEAGELLELGADQQLADEQRVPGVFGEDADLDAVGVIGAAIEVLREQLLAFAVVDEVGQERVEVLARHLAIAVPPHRVPGEVVDDRVLVLRAAAGVMAGLRAERAAGNDCALTRTNSVLVERRLGQIPIYFGEIFKTEFVGAVGTVPHTRFLHEFLPTGGTP